MGEKHLHSSVNRAVATAKSRGGEGAKANLGGGKQNWGGANGIDTIKRHIDKQCFI